jgi:radical SAM protein with 4Fe4S-binding SPASM domain
MAKDFLDMLEVVDEANIPFVAFTTNGLLLNEAVIGKLIATGISVVYVSFDGATPATYAKIRGGASIDKVMNNIRLFNSVKKSLSAQTPAIELHTTLLRSNIEEIEGIIEIAHDLGIARVTSGHLRPYEQMKQEKESLYEHKELFNTCIGLAQKRARELGVHFESPPMFSESSPSARACDAGASKNKLCLGPWNAVVIRADGNVVPCSYWSWTDVFDNIGKSKFSDIWYGLPYQELREEIRNNRPREICARCLGRQY